MSSRRSKSSSKSTDRGSHEQTEAGPGTRWTLSRELYPIPSVGSESCSEVSGEKLSKNGSNHIRYASSGESIPSSRAQQALLKRRMNNDQLSFMLETSALDADDSLTESSSEFGASEPHGWSDEADGSSNAGTGDEEAFVVTNKNNESSRQKYYNHKHDDPSVCDSTVSGLTWESSLSKDVTTATELQQEYEENGDDDDVEVLNGISDDQDTEDTPAATGNQKQDARDKEESPRDCAQSRSKSFDDDDVDDRTLEELLQPDEEEQEARDIYQRYSLQLRQANLPVTNGEETYTEDESQTGNDTCTMSSFLSDESDTYVSQSSAGTEEDSYQASEKDRVPSSDEETEGSSDPNPSVGDERTLHSGSGSRATLERRASERAILTRRSSERAESPGLCGRSSEERVYSSPNGSGRGEDSTLETSSGRSSFDTSGRSTLDTSGRSSLDTSGRLTSDTSTTSSHSYSSESYVSTHHRRSSSNNRYQDDVSTEYSSAFSSDNSTLETSGRSHQSCYSDQFSGLYPIAERNTSRRTSYEESSYTNDDGSYSTSTSSSSPVKHTAGAYRSELSASLSVDRTTDTEMDNIRDDLAGTQREPREILDRSGRSLYGEQSQKSSTTYLTDQARGKLESFDSLTYTHDSGDEALPPQVDPQRHMKGRLLLKEYVEKYHSKSARPPPLAPEMPSHLFRYSSAKQATAKMSANRRQQIIEAAALLAQSLQPLAASATEKKSRNAASHSKRAVADARNIKLENVQYVAAMDEASTINDLSTIDEPISAEVARQVFYFGKHSDETIIPSEISADTDEDVSTIYGGTEDAKAGDLEQGRVKVVAPKSFSKPNVLVGVASNTSVSISNSVKSFLHGRSKVELFFLGIILSSGLSLLILLIFVLAS
eukprot:CAMPEP_0194044712 /NCGR_PEP_ID=MMETSP0009_2-20130614/16134_1 /TAXON_ID=210454 /ORGANISM="Grammatophora oceanica, Strain CCMP 410" /LENGTH=885 /DNA_ID=CAMNT_0038689305 /DNA_START=139 /DNA_END=2796 /DNA_ORIENTATION=+